MDLLKGLLFLLSFCICLSTAAIVSGIEELEEFEEGKIQLTSYFVLFVCLFVCLFDGVYNGTFNNISVISWRSVLLVEETGVPRENH